MFKKLIKWNRRRRFVRAYVILRDEALRHTEAGHNMHFTAVNESHMVIHCIDCPELSPD